MDNHTYAERAAAVHEILSLMRSHTGTVA